MPDVRSARVILSAETASYIAGIKAAGATTVAEMGKAEAAVARGSVTLDKAGQTAGKFAAGGVAALGLAGKAAMDWESQWASVTKTVDATATTSYAKLEDQLRDLATTMPATHEEIAGVAASAGALGVATDDVVNFTETMVKLGETTDDLSADQAATSIAQMTNVMETAPEDVDNLAASLVALGNSGASTEGQIIQMSQRIAGAGALIGLTEDQILAVSNAAASVGIEVEAGGSAISSTFSKMASAALSGGPKLEAFASTTQMTTDEFSRLMKTDPSQAFVLVAQGLDRINQSGGNAFEALKQMGISDLRAQRAMLSLASAGDLLTDSLDMGAKAWEENTALTEEYGKRAATTESQATMAWNQIRDAGITTGQTLLPVIADLAGGVGTLASAFGDLPGPVRDFATAGLAVTTMMAGGLWFGSKVVKGVEGTRNTLASLNAHMATTDTRMGRARAGIRGFGSDLAIMGSTAMTSGARTSRELERSAAAAQRVKGRLGGMAKAGAGLAGLAVLSTGAADGLGLTNTASMALMGTMLGPWGAAMGAGVGAVLDLRSAYDDVADAVDRAHGNIKSMQDLAEMNAAMETLGEQVRDNENRFEGLGDVLGTIKDDIGATLHGDFNRAATEADAYAAALEKVSNTKAGITAVGQALGDSMVFMDLPGTFLDYAPSIQELEQVANRAAPAMEALGISVEDLANMDPKGQREAAAAIADWIQHADSAEGKTEALGDAVAGLDSDMQSTADAATDLAESLEAVFAPAVNLEAATDNWTKSLRTLGDDLADNSRKLKGNSDAAMQNRAAIRSRVGDMVDVLNAEAKAGASSEDLAIKLRSQRRELIQAGVAAGFSRQQMREYVDQLNLTPALVRSIIETVGAEKAAAKVEAVQRLMNRYGMTRAEARALLDDAASGKIKGVQKLIDNYGMSRGEAKALLQDLAKGKLESLISLMDQVDGRHTSSSSTHTNTIVNVVRNIGSTTMGPRIESAAGNIIEAYAGGGTRDPYDRRNAHPPHIAPAGSYRVFAEAETGGESYIPLANDWRRPRAVAIWEETGRRLGLEFQRYAMGGLNAPAYMTSASSTSITVNNDALVGELRALRRQVDVLTRVTGNQGSRFADQLNRGGAVATVGGGW